MARPGLTTHRKFGRLSRRLGSSILARGVLELLWETCYESGDPNVGTAEDIAYAVRWPDEPETLATALAESGFLDVTEDGYAVHDLFDHAPDYVLKRHRREQERKARGAERRRTADTDRRTAPNGSTPSPSPSPSPSHKIKSMSPDGDARDAGDDGFDAFWDAYPKHVAKQDAVKAWKRLKPSPALQTIILSAIDAQKGWRQWREGFVPNPASWLNAKRWDDERPPEERARGVGPPVYGEDWCQIHDPPCRTQADHTRRLLDDERKRRGLEVVTA